MASKAFRMLMPALMLYRLIILIADYMDPRLVALRLKWAFKSRHCFITSIAYERNDFHSAPVVEASLFRYHFVPFITYCIAKSSRETLPAFIFDRSPSTFPWIISLYFRKATNFRYHFVPFHNLVCSVFRGYVHEDRTTCKFLKRTQMYGNNV